MKRFSIMLSIVSLAVFSGHCAVLLEETFDYTAGVNLDDQTGWSAIGSTGEEAVIAAGNLSANGLEPPIGQQVQLFSGISSNEYTAKKITYDAGGRASNEALYVSFLLKVTDVGTLSTTNSRFLCYSRLAAYNGLAIRQHSGDSTKFDIAVAYQPVDVPDDIVWDDHNGTGYSEGDTLFVVYGVTNVSSSGAADLECWINPDYSTFGTTAPAPTLTTRPRIADDGTGDQFYLGCGNGATVILDELRIGESYAEVTPADSTPRSTFFFIK